MARMAGLASRSIKYTSYGRADPVLSLFDVICQKLIKLNDDLPEKPAPLVMWITSSKQIIFRLALTRRFDLFNACLAGQRCDSHWSSRVIKKTILLSAVLTWFVFLPGCADIKSNPDMISVESDPPGATVYAMGKSLGVTPLDIRQRDVFPPTYRLDQEPLYGLIVIRYAGCRDYTQHADIDAYRKGIKAKLECGEQKPADALRAPQKNETSSIEKRLQLLKELQDKGLITEDEAKASRKRILEGL